MKYPSKMTTIIDHFDQCMSQTTMTFDLHDFQFSAKQPIHCYVNKIVLLYKNLHHTLFIDPVSYTIYSRNSKYLHWTILDEVWQNNWVCLCLLVLVTIFVLFFLCALASFVFLQPLLNYSSSQNPVIKSESFFLAAFKRKHKVLLESVITHWNDSQMFLD